MKLKFVLVGALASALALVAVACGDDEEEGAVPPPAPRPAAAPAPAPALAPAPAPAPVPAPAPAPAHAAMMTDITVKMVDGPNYAFDPKTIELTVGTTYTLKLKAGKEFHTFTAKDLGIDQIMPGGVDATVAVTPTKAGTFQLVCLPHQSLGMVAQIVVK